MKKLTLNNVNFAKAEVLSRTQLKKVMGGSGSNDPFDDCNALPGGCPADWSPRLCYIESICPFGTIICVPDDVGCAYYDPRQNPGG